MGGRNQLQQQQKHLLAEIAYAMNPTPENAAKRHVSFVTLVQQQPVLCFRDTEANFLTQMEKSYARLLVTLAESGCPNPDNLTVYQHHTWIESLDAKYEEQKKLLRNAPK